MLTKPTSGKPDIILTNVNYTYEWETELEPNQATVRL